MFNKNKMNIDYSIQMENELFTKHKSMNNIILALNFLGVFLVILFYLIRPEMTGVMFIANMLIFILSLFCEVCFHGYYIMRHMFDYTFIDGYEKTVNPSGFYLNMVFDKTTSAYQKLLIHCYYLMFFKISFCFIGWMAFIIKFGIYYMSLPKAI